MNLMNKNIDVLERTNKIMYTIEPIVQPVGLEYSSSNGKENWTRESYSSMRDTYVLKKQGRSVYLMACPIISRRHKGLFAIKIGSSKDPEKRLISIPGFKSACNTIIVEKPFLIGYTECFTSGECLETRAQQIYLEGRADATGASIEEATDFFTFDRKKDWFLCNNLNAAVMAVLAAIAEISQLDSSLETPDALFWFSRYNDLNKALEPQPDSSNSEYPSAPSDFQDSINIYEQSFLDVGVPKFQATQYYMATHQLYSSGTNTPCNSFVHFSSRVERLHKENIQPSILRFWTDDKLLYDASSWQSYLVRESYAQAVNSMRGYR